MKPDTPPLSLPDSWLDGDIPHPELELNGLRRLKEGRVGVLMLAGGLSTRMNTSAIRGDLPVGAVTGRSLFQLQGERISALRERFAPALIWLVMTSPSVHEATLQSFHRHNTFGFPAQDLFFFQQPSFPVLDENGKPVIMPDGRRLESPGGNGGMLRALGESGLLELLERRGVTELFYFQYPNVLENICDPVMIGYHHDQRHEVTIKAVRDSAPDEPMGKCVKAGEDLQIVEYHDIEAGANDSVWNNAPACMGTYLWSLAFIKRCLEKNIVLPSHTLRLDLPEKPGLLLYKQEQFSSDLASLATAKGLVIVDRAAEYAPVKTPAGIYSLDSARAALSNRDLGWLLRAGAKPAKGNNTPRVEISPHFALNLRELKEKVMPGFQIEDGLVLE